MNQSEEKLEEPSIVTCDMCGNEVEKSKMVIDKGVNFPKLIKEAKEEGKDHLELCTNCAEQTSTSVNSTEEENLENDLSDIRKFL